MKVSSSNVDIPLRSFFQQQRADGIGDQAYDGDNQHQVSGDRGRMREPFNCLLNQEEADDDERARIDDRRQNLGALQAECIFQCPRSLAQPDRSIAE